METSLDKECSAIGALFQQVIGDMKATTPLWEDFLSKAAKLHTVLKSALSVVGAYLDAFQKIADAATNAKGATKDIGTVLTRICLRHKAVEARLKTFTSALMECLVLPLHEKMDEWRKNVVNLDKDHAKESKKLKGEVKKRSAEAGRWHKKAQKVRAGIQSNTATGFSAANQEILRAAEAAQMDLAARLTLLQDTEKQALRSALVEERSRFCLFVSFLKPVMSEEMAMMAELSHMEDILTQLEKQTADPFTLPEASEQMISELKGSMDQATWSLRTPPSSPSSLGSRKSSMCSLGSIHSSSSGSVTPHSQGQMQSPSHGIGQSLAAAQHIRHRSLSQAAGVGIRLSSVSSQDSGFTSQDTLVVLRPTSSPPAAHLSAEVGSCSEDTWSAASSSSSTPLSPYPPAGLPNALATWPNLQETVQYDRSTSGLVSERPHTISTAYEKGHQRPALSVYTFQPLETSHQGPVNDAERPGRSSASHNQETPCSDTLRRLKETAASSQENLIYGACRPPLPQRCSSLERPKVPNKSGGKNKQDSETQQPTALPDFHSSGPDMIVPQPLYMNANELGGVQERNTCDSVDHDAGSAIYSSLGSSSGYGSHYFDDGQGYADPASVEPWQNRHQKAGAPFLKRTSLSSFATLHEVLDDSATGPSEGTETIDDADLMNLPPPPDFLLEVTPSEEEVHPPPQDFAEQPIRVSEAIKNLSQILQHPVPADHLRRTRSARVESSEESIYCKLETKEELSVRNMQAIYETSAVSQVKVTKPRRHSDLEPASPPCSTLPKPAAAAAAASLSKQSHARTLPRESSLQKTASDHLIASLNAKLAQRQSAAQTAQAAQAGQSPYHEVEVQHLRRKDADEPRVVSGLLSRQNFVNSLNATLAKQQEIPKESEVAIRVRQVVAQRCVADPSLCRESLLDQIRRGTSLRRSRHADDRSTPRI